MNRRRLSASLLGTGLVGAVLIWTVSAHAATSRSDPVIQGGATTMIQGGTGAPEFTPVLTKLAFHWGPGPDHLECLALAPSVPAGQPGSGNFDTNVMYVTGAISSAQVSGPQAILTGWAEVTGIGAGHHKRFTLTVTRGGHGAAAVLKVSGLTFNETVLEGQFTF